jgi:hypothetical protein
MDGEQAQGPQLGPSSHTYRNISILIKAQKVHHLKIGINVFLL